MILPVGKLLRLEEREHERSCENQAQAECFSFDVAFMEDDAAQSEGDDDVASAHQGQDGDLDIGAGHGVEIECVGDDEGDAGNGDGPAPVKRRLVDFEQFCCREGCQSEDDYQVDGEMELDEGLGESEGVQEEFVVERRHGSQERSRHDECHAASVPGEAFQLSPDGEQVLSCEDSDHSDGLSGGGEFSKEDGGAEECPERGCCADRSCQGDGHGLHGGIDAGPACGDEQGFECDEQEVLGLAGANVLNVAEAQNEQHVGE